MRQIPNERLSQFNVTVFSEGAFLGQWGFDSKKAALDYITSLRADESFGKGVRFVAHLSERLATYASE